MKKYTVEIIGYHGAIVGTLGPFRSLVEAERALASVAARVGEPAQNNNRISGARLAIETYGKED